MTPWSFLDQLRVRTIDLEVTVSPSPRATRSSAAVAYSTSICGSILTPACCARSRSWRRVGSSTPQRASQRISGASARRSIVIGSSTCSGSALTYSSSSRIAGRTSSPRSSTGQGDEPCLQPPFAHLVGDLGGVLADRADTDVGVARAEVLDQAAEQVVVRAAERAERDRAAGDVADLADRSAASCAAATVRSACGRSSRPASVSSSPRPARVNSGTPSSASSRRICSDRLGWAMNSDSAAAEKEPCSTAARK